MRSILFCGLLALALGACQESKKLSASATVARHYVPAQIQFDTVAYQERMYVPIYSEIYFNSEDQYFPLFTTLSIRNTSMTQPLYVRTVDFYNTQGKRIKAYLTQPIVLTPLQTVEFAGKSSDKGGSGANFIVEWGAQQLKPRPIVQAVMIGGAYQQGISFVTEGVPLDTLPYQPLSPSH